MSASQVTPLSGTRIDNFRRRILALPLPLAAGCAGLMLGLWAYWPTLREIAAKWSTDPQYSHGYLVPVFGLVLLWLRRQQLATGTLSPSAWGLVLLGVALAARLAGTYFYFDWLDAVSILPCLAGLCVLVGGWPALRWAWPAIGFLFFMLPLPYRVEVALSHPLQQIATAGSTYALQTLGLPALAEGNVIVLGKVRIGVVEACNGLSMLLIFFAVSTAVALLSGRPWIDRLLIVVSAVPIALVANVIRITVTGVMHRLVGSAAANVFFHDLAGWFMMPLALVLLWLELWVLGRLLVPWQRSMPIGFGPRKPAGNVSAPARKTGSCTPQQPDALSLTREGL